MSAAAAAQQRAAADAEARLHARLAEAEAAARSAAAAQRAEHERCSASEGAAMQARHRPTPGPTRGHDHLLQCCKKVRASGLFKQLFWQLCPDKVKSLWSVWAIVLAIVPSMLFVDSSGLRASGEV